MDIKNQNKVLIILLILVLLMSAFLYTRYLNIKDELGDNYLRYIQSSQFEIKQSINYLESGDLKEELIGYHLNNFASMTGDITSKWAGLNFNMILNGYYDPKRIYNDRDYREKAIAKLRECDKALQYILDDIEKYKHNLLKVKLFRVQPDTLEGRVYYDYFTQKPEDKTRYNNKFHEIFYKMVPIQPMNS